MRTHESFAPRALDDAQSGGGKPSLLTVISGKGGVGKSTIAFNLAIAAGRSGMRTLLVDLDWQLGNLHILANVHARRSFENVISQPQSVSEALTPINDTVSLLASAAISGISMWPTADEVQFFFVNAADRLSRFDLMIVDTPSGISEQVAVAAALSDEVLITLNPELTALSAAYGQYKWLIGKAPEVSGSLLVNRASGAEEAREISKSFVALCARFLGRKPKVLGFLHEDRALVRAVARQRSVFAESPQPVIARQFSTLAGQVGERLFKNRTAAQRQGNAQRLTNNIEQSVDNRE